MKNIATSLLLCLCFAVSIVRAQVTESDSRHPTITKEQAIADIEQFRKLLEEKSSYACTTDYDYQRALDKLKEAIEKSPERGVRIFQLEYTLSKILSLIGDRHSEIKDEGFNEHLDPIAKKHLPVPMARLNSSVVALKQVYRDGKDGPTRKKGHYTLLDPQRPNVSKVDGKSITDHIDAFGFKHRTAPPAAEITKGLDDAHAMGKQILQSGGDINKRKVAITVHGTNSKQTTVHDLSDKNEPYLSRVEHGVNRKMKDFKQVRVKGLRKVDKDGIAYLQLPVMPEYGKKRPLFEKAFKEMFSETFKDSKALIIDLRYNPGGSRDVLNDIGRYIVPPQQSPWIGNTMQPLTTVGAVHADMVERGLMQENSDKLSPQDKAAIAAFKKKFKPAVQLTCNRFRQPYYHIIRCGQFHYNKPVYILVNEKTFSAASVFAAVLKDLPNVKIVGVTTDGSSGNSLTHELKNSKLKVKLSSAVSFQRNGNLLDGTGTAPDIPIEPDLDQVLGKEDTQLKRLKARINNTK